MLMAIKVSATGMPINSSTVEPPSISQAAMPQPLMPRSPHRCGALDDMLIPPSALTVLLGSLSGISISKLLIGGVVPGLLLAFAFVAWIIVRVRLTPSLAPNVELVRHPGFARFKPFVLYVLPLVSIFGVVV